MTRVIIISVFSLLFSGLASAHSLRDPEPQPRGDVTLDCGDLHYDDGTAENAIFFGGGNAGDPQYFLGVRFELQDFGLIPGYVSLTGFCISNQFNFTGQGGPWPNRVFVYRDTGGEPDLDSPVRVATMITGDGTGAYEVAFDEPWVINEPEFWIMTRGDLVFDGEDFNVEADQDSEPAGKSWITDRGLSFIYQTEQNLMFRAEVAPSGVPPAAVPGPGRLAWLCGILLMLLMAFWARRPFPGELDVYNDDDRH